MDYLTGDADGKPIDSTQLKSTEIEEILDEVEINFRRFKKFDIVSVPSDHHYLKRSSKKHRSGFINTEWGILEKKLHLPSYSSIYVRVYEGSTNVDLMRAVVVGPRDTPYCYGLFFFDIWFPPDYPISPPRFYYHSHGYDINPNLCKNGEVRLTLLKTLNGNMEDRWIPYKSNVLQVLETIQTSVLSANSMKYNERVFVLSCKKMWHTLWKPPKDFEDLVKGHFRNSSHYILLTCKNYINRGADMGDAVKLLYKRFEANGSYCKHFRQLVETENKGATYRESRKEDETRDAERSYFNWLSNPVNMVESEKDWSGNVKHRCSIKENESHCRHASHLFSILMRRSHRESTCVNSQEIPCTNFD